MDSTHPVFQKALELLRRRMYGSEELRRKLRRAGTHDEVDQTLEELRRLHLLNDASYGSMVVEHYSRKAIGRQKIVFECRKKGISSSVVDETLERLGWNEAEQARAALRNKRGDTKQRILFLRSRGFRDSVIKNLILS